MAQATPIQQTIAALMAEQDLTERRLAEIAGLNPTGVRDILLGKSRNPRHDTLQKIAGALGVTIERLLNPAPLDPRDEMRVLNAYRRLSDRERRRYLALLEMAAADAEAPADE